MWDTNSNPKCPTLWDNVAQGVSGCLKVFQRIPGPTPNFLRPTRTWKANTRKLAQSSLMCDSIQSCQSYKRQGSTKLSLLSEITESPNSHGNYSLEFTRKKSRKCVFWQKHVHVCQLWVYVTERSVCDRKKSLWKNRDCAIEKSLCHRKKFLS